MPRAAAALVMLQSFAVSMNILNEVKSRFPSLFIINIPKIFSEK